MVDGGSTLLNAAKTLRNNGARSVRCVITHALLSKGADEKLLNAEYASGIPLIDRIFTTDSCPNVLEKSRNLLLKHHNSGGFISPQSTAPLIFNALKRA
jgi:phosphoribosylpyrophosphate synthetase